MWSTIAKVLTVAICLFLQIGQSQAHFQTTDFANQNHGAHQFHLQFHHQPQGQAAQVQGNNVMQFLQQHLPKIQQNMNHWIQAPQVSQQAVATWIGGLGQTAEIIKAQEILLKQHIHRLMMVHRTKANFYNSCGTTTRSCQWALKLKHVMSKLAVEGQEQTPAEPQKPEYEQLCSYQKIVCVGNTETCVSKRNCDVAMRITEKGYEGRFHHLTRVEAVSVLNLCHWDEQSVEDSTKIPQMLEGVGFATFDKAGHLKCRHPRAHDFKLIFLRKNNGMENEGAVCKRKPANDSHVVANENHMLMNAIKLWPTMCKLQYEGKQEHSQYDLQSYLKHHVEVSRYSSYFAPPFNFAENLEYQTSSKGMVITGVAKSE